MSEAESFEGVYRITAAPQRRAVERRVLGSDYGANGYTTLEQANAIARRLDLDGTGLLLDIGSGSGWPALRVVDTLGCRAVLTDLPREGLDIARERALADGLADRVALVQTGGSSLPFRDLMFDGVTHSDVLC